MKGICNFHKKWSYMGRLYSHSRDSLFFHVRYLTDQQDGRYFVCGIISTVIGGCIMAQVAVIQIVNLFGLWHSSSQMIHVFVHITHHYILVGLFLPLLPHPHCSECSFWFLSWHLKAVKEDAKPNILQCPGLRFLRIFHSLEDEYICAPLWKCGGCYL